MADLPLPQLAGCPAREESSRPMPGTDSAVLDDVFGVPAAVFSLRVTDRLLLHPAVRPAREYPGGAGRFPATTAGRRPGSLPRCRCGSTGARRAASPPYAP